jgi:hypothetical protein
MYSTLLYLAFLIGGRRFEEKNYMARIDQVILLYLTYLLVLLTDYVIDGIHYQSVSN